MDKVIRVTVAEAEARFEELMDGVLRGERRWVIVREDGQVVRHRGAAMGRVRIYCAPNTLNWPERCA